MLQPLMILVNNYKINKAYARSKHDENIVTCFMDALSYLGMGKKSNMNGDSPSSPRLYTVRTYALYRQGFRFWFSREEILRLSVRNKQFETPHLEHELVQQYFRRPVGKEPGEFISVALALQLVGVGITQKLSSVLLGRAFMELGFERRTCRNVRGYIVVRRLPEEMRSLRTLMAQESSPETPAPETPAHETNTDTDDTLLF